MARHFISRLTCISALLISIPLSICANAAPHEGPSFDCGKAASVSEKTICANATLSLLDFQLGKTWKALLDAFSDTAQKTQMRVEQRAWITQRGKCGGDVSCIGKLYRGQLSILNGSDPAHRFSGVYEVKDTGGIAVYPIGNHYLVSIQGAEPSEGRWVCELIGEGEAVGDELEVSVDKLVFRVRMQDADTLVVPNSKNAQTAASQYCGLNGTFAFSYHRIRVNP